MSVDCSRFTFHPWKDYFGVVMQQGRVQLDADWNEWVAQVARRLQAGTMDTLGPATAGRAVVPSTTPSGFAIAAEAGGFRIGAGRLYVDGWLLENHGAPDKVWDTRLAEITGTTAVSCFEQPYLPFNPVNEPAPADVFNRPALAGGPHLVYVDVWQRDVTHLHDPDLVEKAIGVDTTARTQTVWQVRVLENVGNVTCATDDDDVPAWSALVRPSGARLTTSTGDLPGDPNPCLVPPAAGYKGLENQLYRVEVHRGGPQGTATFKWSRDNATIATRVTEIQGGTRLVVESLGRDDVLGFHAGQWVEVLDDWHELHGRPGLLRRIRPGDGVDAATRSILFNDALPAGLFPVDAQGRTDATRHTRVRRWDQSNQVRRLDGSVFHDLNPSASSNGIPVPPAGTVLALENGILVEIGLPDGGEYRTGDYWVIAARVADGSIDLLDEAPPRGIHHHYARLAIVTLPDTETDCRLPWPPEAGEGSCDCSVCVSAESHSSGTLTIQAAIEQAKQTGGTVCIGPGTYNLREPVRLLNARSVRVRGQGWATVLVATAGGEALQVVDSINVVVENLAVVTAAIESARTAVTLRNAFDVMFQRLHIFNVTVGDQTSIAIAIEGYALNTHVAECLLGAGIGILGGRRGDGYLLTAGLRITDNTFACADRGISLERLAVHIGDARVTGNAIRGCRQIGIAALGGVAPGGTLDIGNNLLEVEANGILAGTDGLRIAENDIRARPGELPGDGVVLVRGLDPTGIDTAQILANRVLELRGHGIALRTRVNSGMIKMNIISEVTGGGIVMEGEGEAGQLVVENNQLLGVGLGGNVQGLQVAAMRFVATQDLDVRANAIANFAREARQSQARTAILAVASERTRITGNHIAGVAPMDGFVGQSTGIGVIAPFHAVSVAENAVRRRGADADKLAPGEWVGIGVRGRVDNATPDERFGFIPLGDIAVGRLAESVFVFTGTSLRLAAVLPSGEVTLRANEVESEFSTTSPVAITTATGCRVVDNRIALLPVETTDRRLANPSLVRARRAIVSSNDLCGPGGPEAEVLRVQLAGEGEAAIVGNLRSGVIVLNNALLGDPWAPLNPLSRE